jgi:hypothetical protein
MPGHYTKCAVEAPFTQVFEALKREFGNIYAKRFSGDREIGLILGQQCFLRVNSDVAIAIILQSAGNEKTTVEIISSAGTIGMLGMTWNAHKAFASKVKEHLTREFKSKTEQEISYFRTPSTSKAFLKKCPKCGKDIPIASETCPFCHSQQ